MNLQLTSNILVLWITSLRMILALQGCSEREERALISAPSASTRKLLEDLLPQAVVRAIHDALPISLHLAKVSCECITPFAITLMFDNCHHRSIMLWDQLRRQPPELPSPADTATTRATSTSTPARSLDIHGQSGACQRHVNSFP